VRESLQAPSCTLKGFAVSEQNVDVARSNYDVGKTNFLSLAQAQRSAIDVRQKYQQTSPTITAAWPNLNRARRRRAAGRRQTGRAPPAGRAVTAGLPHPVPPDRGKYVGPAERTVDRKKRIHRSGRGQISARRSCESPKLLQVDARLVPSGRGTGCTFCGSACPDSRGPGRFPAGRRRVPARPRATAVASWPPVIMLEQKRMTELSRAVRSPS